MCLVLFCTSSTSDSPTPPPGGTLVSDVFRTGSGPSFWPLGDGRLVNWEMGRLVFGLRQGYQRSHTKDEKLKIEHLRRRILNTIELFCVRGLHGNREILFATA